MCTTGNLELEFVETVPLPMEALQLPEKGVEILQHILKGVDHTSRLKLMGALAHRFTFGVNSTPQRECAN